MTTETHPLEPFLPPNAHTLFLGSFPPPPQRWSMDFFYPNFTNDFWRIMGLVYFEDARHFEDATGLKRFDRSAITEFCFDEGLAFFDIALKVRRLRDNASDAFLEIVEPADVGALLDAMPVCRRIVTTGGKAAEELAAILSVAANSPVAQPRIGEFSMSWAFGRELEWWRMPSSSRAYPLSIEKKAAAYASLLRT